MEKLLLMIVHIKNYCKDDPTNIICTNKAGALIPYMTPEGKDIFPTSASVMPMSSIMSWAAYGGASLFQNVLFSNFSSNATYCGMSQQIINANSNGADYHPTLTITNSEFHNVDTNAFRIHLQSSYWMGNYR